MWRDHREVSRLETEYQAASFFAPRHGQKGIPANGEQSRFDLFACVVAPSRQGYKDGRAAKARVSQMRRLMRCSKSLCITCN